MRAAALAVLVLALGAGPQARYARLGNRSDRVTHPQGGFALLGGGTDVDQAFQWMCELSHGGDFLVLRASGTPAYDAYIRKLCPAENSAATLIITSRAQSAAPAVARHIREAEAIFIAGGDQSNYVNFWTGTPVQKGLQAAIARGVPIGGTSAGLAVLGEWAYSAQHDTAQGPDLDSAAALANPYQHQVVLVHNFLRIPALRGVITDTHFHNRDRLGRLLVFMARILQDKGVGKIAAIGVDQHTAVLVDPDGRSVIAGTGHAYFFSAAGKPANCRRGEPLSFGPIAVRRLSPTQTFNLKSWTGQGEVYELRVKNGQVRSNQTGGGIY